jgi:hypothetical protein
MGDRRRYFTQHQLDAQQAVSASVKWNGQDWTVTVGDDDVPDCCSTIEGGF